MWVASTGIEAGSAHPVGNQQSECKFFQSHNAWRFLLQEESLRVPPVALTKRQVVTESNDQRYARASFA
jgi:hypothetical protein